MSGYYCTTTPGRRSDQAPVDEFAAVPQVEASPVPVRFVIHDSRLLVSSAATFVAVFCDRNLKFEEGTLFGNKRAVVTHST